MSVRSRCLTIANRVRKIPASPAFDERPTRVTIRTRTWAGGRRGAEGGKTDADLVLEPRPRVRELSAREITSSVGRYATGDIAVGPITPFHATGGYTEAQLAPVGVTGTEIVYVLEGNVNGEFARVDLSTDRSHSWTLILRRRRP